MAFLVHLTTMLWKQYIYRKRRLLQTILMMFVSLSFIGGLHILRYKFPVMYSPKFGQDLPYINFLDPWNRTSHQRPEMILFRGHSDFEIFLAYIFHELKQKYTALNQVEIDFKAQMTTEEVEQYYIEKGVDPMNILHIIIETTNPRQLEYLILWRKLSIFDMKATYSGSPSALYRDYSSTGILLIKRIIAQAFETLQMDENIHLTYDGNIYLQEMPYPSNIMDPNNDYIMWALPTAIACAFFVPFLESLSDIFMKRDVFVTEIFMLAGVPRTVSWLSWYIHQQFIMISLCALMTFLLVTPFLEGRPLMYGTHFAHTFGFFTVFSMQMGTLGLLVCTALKIVMMGSPLLLVVVIYLCLELLDIWDEYWVDYLRIVLLNDAIESGLALQIDGKLIGSQDRNVGKMDVFTDHMRMMGLRTAGYFFLSLYIDSVLGKSIGISRPYNFFLKRAFWKPIRVKAEAMEESIAHAADSEFFERQDDREADVYINKLSKTYSLSHREARAPVNGVSMKICCNEITVILGHEGCGNITLLQMLAGFVDPSNGSATVNGFEINNVSGKRDGVGYAPKDPILLELLTVKEQLTLFQRLRCDRWKWSVDDEMMQIARDINLQTKLYTKVADLSVQQKKRLSIGIALTTGTKVVLLEEPTVGLDPASVRKIRYALIQASQTRTVIVATSQKREADLLGDRIAIMAGGCIKCYGSAFFLKSLCGAGSRLVIVKRVDCDGKGLLQLVQSFKSIALLDSIIGTEISFLLMDELSKYTELFDALARNMYKLGILEYSLRSTTMEEIFDNENEDYIAQAKSRVGLPEKFATNKQSLKNEISPHTPVPRESQIDRLVVNTNCHKLSGWRLYLKQFRAVFLRRAVLTWRYRDLCLVQLIVFIGYLSLAIHKFQQLESKRKLKYDSLTDDMYDVKYVTDITTTHTIVWTSTKLEEAEFYPRQNVSVSHTKYTLERLYTDSKTRNQDELLIQKAKQLGINKFYATHFIAYGVTWPNDTGDPRTTTSTTQSPWHYHPQMRKKRPLPESMTGRFNIFLPEGQNLALDFLLTNLVRGNSLIEDLSISSRVSVYDKKNKGDVNARTLRRMTINANEYGTKFYSSIILLPCLMMYLLIKERQEGGRRMHNTSGLSPIIYWAANFTWDIITQLLINLCVLPFLAYFERWIFDEGHLTNVLMVLMTHTLATVNMVYGSQFFFTDPTLGVVVILASAKTCGFFYERYLKDLKIMPFAYFTAKIKKHIQEKVRKQYLHVFRLVNPHVCAAESFAHLFINHNRNLQCAGINCTTVSGACCDGACTHPPCMYGEVNDYADKWPGDGELLQTMILQAVVGFIILLFMESALKKHFLSLIYFLNRKLRKHSKIHPKDSDVFFEMADATVAAERRRVVELEDNELVSQSRKDDIALVNVFLRHGLEVAVQEMNVTVPKTECLGLLGNTDAWKSLTLRILTGEVDPTSGTAYITGLDVSKNKKRVRDVIGYCAETDCHSPELTGRELLTYHAHIRGIKEKDIETRIFMLLSTLGLERHIEVLVRNYSATNARKLSIAVALMGNPVVLLLDEPTSMMDYVSQRDLWKLLLEARGCGCTIMLNSHRLHECETVCSRIALVNNGRLEFLSDQNYLREKYSSGHLVIVKMAMGNDGRFESVSLFMEEMREHFPSTYLISHVPGAGHFHITEKNTKLEEIFLFLEKSKQQGILVDYSANAMSVEQVFAALTNQAEQLNPATQQEDMSVYPVLTCKIDQEF